MEWRKASFSDTGNGCVEIGWKKSTFSNSGNGCVELANTLSAVRDSKNPDGPTITVDVRPLIESLKH